MTRKVIRQGGFVALVLLTLVLGTPAWVFAGGIHVHFVHRFGLHGGATFPFGFSHPSFFPHPRHRGFLVLGFQKVWVPGQWVWMGDHWEWMPGQWVQIPKGVGVWVPGRWLVLDP